MKRLSRYGQHFLRSPRLVAELVGHSNIRKNDIVVDLGAGSGVITYVLARRAKQVIAVEIEPNAVKKLRQNTSELSNVSIVEGDMTTVNLPESSYKVFSNIPFQLSSAVVRRLTSCQPAPRSIYLIVQQQFARKIVPSSQHFTGQLGAEIAPWWQTRIRKPLRRNDFTPPPGVDTVLLEIKPRSDFLLAPKERDSYIKFVASCYSRQKYFTGLPRSAVGINPERKPSELSAVQWVQLYEMTNKIR